MNYELSFKIATAVCGTLAGAWGFTGKLTDDRRKGLKHLTWKGWIAMMLTIATMVAGIVQFVIDGYSGSKRESIETTNQAIILGEIAKARMDLKVDVSAIEHHFELIEKSIHQELSPAINAKH